MLTLYVSDSYWYSGSVILAMHEFIPYAPQSPAERLTATSRLALAVFSLLAVWLDPSKPPQYAHIASTILIAYVVYAGLIALLVWRTDAPRRGLRYVTHASDMLIFAVLIYVTEGSISPFFLSFVFSLFCAMVYWQWYGVMWTMLVALMVFLGLNLYAVEVSHNTTFALHRFLMRSTYLGVVAAFLTYFSAYHQRLSGGMTRLASWSPVVPSEGQVLVRDILQHAAAICSVPRVLMVWEEPEEPWRQVAWWSQGAFQWTQEPSTTFEPLVAAPLADTYFFCPALRGGESTVLYQTATGLQRWTGMPLHAEVYARFRPRAVLARRLQSEHLQGWLLLLDASAITLDTLLLGAVVAHEVTARLEQYYLLQQVQQAAAAAERIHLARDLHDGVLQSFSGVALHLANIRRLLVQEPEKVGERLTEVEQLIGIEQRNLRALIQTLRPSPTLPSQTTFILTPLLKELCQRIERLWDLRVNMRLEGLELELPDALPQGVYYIVHEALTNAARHAHAAQADVALVVQNLAVRLTVRDNGRGFPLLA